MYFNVTVAAETLKKASLGIQFMNSRLSNVYILDTAHWGTDRTKIVICHSLKFDFCVSNIMITYSD